jgi:hypothetical protein
MKLRTKSRLTMTMSRFKIDLIKIYIFGKLGHDVLKISIFSINLKTCEKIECPFSNLIGKFCLIQVIGLPMNFRLVCLILFFIEKFGDNSQC